MIELVISCIIAGHKEIGPSLFETDLVCPESGLVITFSQTTKKVPTSKVPASFERYIDLIP